MTIQSKKKYSGSGSISTLGSQIRIEEARGRMVIYDQQTMRELVVIDSTGVHVNSDNGDELVNIDGNGFLFSFNDERRILLGLKPDGSDVGSYITRAGLDVIDELSA